MPNFRSKSAYKKWLAYGHASGKFAQTPGHQEVSIAGKHRAVKHQDGGPVNPIKVQDKNDPRLKAYNDSLIAYNKFVKQRDFIKQDASEYFDDGINDVEYNYYDKERFTPVGHYVLDRVNPPVQPVVYDSVYRTMEPSIRPMSKITPRIDTSINLTNDRKVKNLGPDRIMMPSGEEVSKSKFIKQYGQKAWERATNQKLQHGGMVNPPNGRYVNLKKTVNDFNKQQGLAEAYIDKVTGTTQKQRAAAAGINPLTSNKLAVGNLEYSDLDPIDMVSGFPAAALAGKTSKSIIKRAITDLKNTKPSTTFHTFPEEWYHAVTNRVPRDYTNLQSPNKWLHPPGERLDNFEFGGQIQQQTNMKNIIPINVEGGELLINPNTFEKLRFYKGQAPHNDNGKDPAKNIVGAPEGSVVIPKNKAKLYDDAFIANNTTSLQSMVMALWRGQQEREAAQRMKLGGTVANIQQVNLSSDGSYTPANYTSPSGIGDYYQSTKTGGGLNTNNSAFGNTSGYMDNSLSTGNPNLSNKTYSGKQIAGNLAANSGQIVSGISNATTPGASSYQKGRGTADAAFGVVGSVTPVGAVVNQVRNAVNMVADPIRKNAEKIDPETGKIEKPGRAAAWYTVGSALDPATAGLTQASKGKTFSSINEFGKTLSAFSGFGGANRKEYLKELDRSDEIAAATAAQEDQIRNNYLNQHTNQWLQSQQRMAKGGIVRRYAPGGEVGPPMEDGNFYYNELPFGSQYIQPGPLDYSSRQSGEYSFIPSNPARDSWIKSGQESSGGLPSYQSTSPYSMPQNVNIDDGSNRRSKRWWDKDTDKPGTFNWRDAGTAAAGFGLNSTGSIYDLILSRKGYDKVNYPRVNPQYVKDDAARADIWRVHAANKYEARRLGTSDRSVLNMMLSSSGKTRGALTTLGEQTANANAQIGNRAQEANAQIGMREQDATAENKARWEDIRRKAVGDIGKNATYAINDYGTGKTNKLFMDMYGSSYGDYRKIQEILKENPQLAKYFNTNPSA